VRKKHCSFAVLSNGRCKAHCHYNLDDSFDGDCTGNTNKLMEGQREVRASGGYVPYKGSGMEKLDLQAAYLERMKGNYGI